MTETTSTLKGPKLMDVARDRLHRLVKAKRFNLERDAEELRGLLVKTIITQVTEVSQDTTIPDNVKLDPSGIPGFVTTSQVGDAYQVKLDRGLWDRLRMFEFGSATLGVRPHPKFRGFMSRVHGLLVEEGPI